MNSQNKSYKGLDLRHPKVEELSTKYNLSLKTVAYLRAALAPGKYTKETLVTHIQEGKARRLEAIEKHKNNDQVSDEEREKLILYTNLNIEFRDGVIEILERLSDSDIRDIIA